MSIIIMTGPYKPLQAGLVQLSHNVTISNLLCLWVTKRGYTCSSLFSFVDWPKWEDKVNVTLLLVWWWHDTCRFVIINLCDINFLWCTLLEGLKGYIGSRQKRPINTFGKWDLTIDFIENRENTSESESREGQLYREAFFRFEQKCNFDLGNFVTR